MNTTDPNGAFLLRQQYTGYSQPTSAAIKAACTRCGQTTLKLNAEGCCEQCHDAAGRETKGSWYRAPLRGDRR